MSDPSDQIDMGELTYQGDYLWGIVMGTQVIDGVLHRNEFVVDQFSASEAWAGGTMVASNCPVLIPVGRIEYCHRLTDDEVSAFWGSLGTSEDEAGDGVAAPA